MRQRAGQKYKPSEHWKTKAAGTENGSSVCLSMVTGRLCLSALAALAEAAGQLNLPSLLHGPMGCLEGLLSHLTPARFFAEVSAAAVAGKPCSMLPKMSNTGTSWKEVQIAVDQLKYTSPVPIQTIHSQEAVLSQRSQ